MGMVDCIGTSSEEITTLSLSGLTCVACASSISSALTALDGVESVRCSAQLQRAIVIHRKEVDPKELKSVVEDLGYGAELGQRSPEVAFKMLQRAEELARLREAFKTSVIFTAVILLISESRLLPFFGWPTWLDPFWLSIISSAILGGAVQVRCGSFIYINSWNALRRGRVNMDTLIVLSNSMGTILSTMDLIAQGSNIENTYFLTCSALTMVVIGGRYLDSLTKKKAGESLVELFARRAETAVVKDRQGKRMVPASFLRPPDEIMIEPYTVIPCDCYVIQGISQVDESVISGESVPVSKSQGSLLLSGSRNGSNCLTAVVYKDQENSTISMMIKDVSGATETEAYIPGIAEFVMQWFVSGVICLAVVSGFGCFHFLGPNMPLLRKINIVGKRVMAVVTSACPCALGLSVPSAIMAGNDVARWCGILNISGANVMRTLKSITYIVMDKTGTLTEGILKVKGCDIDDTWARDWKRFCLLVCAVEEPGSAIHPAGRAIFERYFPEISDSWSEHKSKCQTSDLCEVPGEGVYSKIILADRSLHDICLGNVKMMRRYNITWDEKTYSDTEEYLVVHIAIDGKYVGRILLQDTVRTDVHCTIERLKARNVEMMILTGDRYDEAERVSKQVNIPKFAALASPSMKLSIIKKLQSEGHKVALVGDGMNDAPSLAAADVGIMLCNNQQSSTLGGHVLILSPKFSSLATLFEIADHTMQQVQSNLFWSFVYNSTAISLALGIGEPFGIIITPPVGAGLMSLSSASIALRSLLMKKRLLAQLSKKLLQEGSYKNKS